MKLCIFGTRDLEGAKVVEAIFDAIELHKPDAIVTAGEPHGVCELARKAAQEAAIPLHLHWLNRSAHARGAWQRRSEACLKEADHCLLVHDGKSRGTSNELRDAKKMGVAFTYLVIGKPS